MHECTVVTRLKLITNDCEHRDMVYMIYQSLSHRHQVLYRRSLLAIPPSTIPSFHNMHMCRPNLPNLALVNFKLPK